jgi:2-dehydro-3-deoxyphosphogluconate aldolase/(4S)-4-hydroxy-2-oxoglutarate aldolase
MDEKQAELAADAGAEFVVSPHTDEKVITKTRELGLVSIPGALTPTEIVSAYSSGAHFVKVFPAGELGLKYVKALMAPITHIPLIAVGGIDINNAADFISLGLKGVGAGASVARNDLIPEGRFDEIETLAREFVTKISKPSEGDK